PGVKRKLRAFADCADKQAQCNRQKTSVTGLETGGLWENFCKIRASEGGDQQEDPQEKSEVPDAVHDKCLFGCIIIRIVLVPEADQEVRTQAHSFPADEHDRIT